MEPPLLNRGTAAAVSLIPSFDREGRSICVALIKERFRLLDRGYLARTHDAEVHVADEMLDPDHPASSSIKAPSDLCLRKPSTDVIVTGSAMAPGRPWVRELGVSVRVGEVGGAVKVSGDRRWERGALGLSLGEPVPFQEMPLSWENAFGGADYESDPERPLEEPRNPSGRGLVRHGEELLGSLAPNVEHPGELLSDPSDRPTPVGFSAIGRHWEPRRRYAGTYDERWMQERMPLPPLDFDDRFHQAAPPWMITPSPLRGGEPVEVLGMSEEGPFALALPRISFFVGSELEGEGMREHRTQIDTLLLEPNARSLVLTWRALIPLPRRAHRLRYVQVHERRVAR